jgi:membrane protein implicated in regulation of membrane protease activity
MTPNPTVIWLIIGLLLVFAEFAAPGVILIFFGAGAWVVAITTYFGFTPSLESQLLSFAAASILLLVTLRRRISGSLHGHVSNVQDPGKNLDEFSGKTVVVLKDVGPGRADGLVEFKGSSWKAVSDEHIAREKVAVISDIEGITLKIRREE